jgi:hypothetical protein
MVPASAALASAAFADTTCKYRGPNQGVRPTLLNFLLAMEESGQGDWKRSQNGGAHRR